METRLWHVLSLLHAHTAPHPEEEPARLPSLRDSERAHIIRVLEHTSWNKLEAARVLDIGRGTLYRKIDEYGLEPAAGAARRKGRRAVSS